MARLQEINCYLVPFFDNKILVLKRKNGYWEFPGGGIEWGESPENAAKREALEEIGLEIENLRLIGVTSATYEKDGNDKHSIYIVYMGTTKSKEVKISKEHDAFMWISVEELDYLRLGLNVQDIVRFIRETAFL